VTRAILGRGYRIADPTELHGLLIRPDGFIYEGNPGLETESGANLELGASYSSNGLDAGVTLFRNDLRNLISSVLLPDSTIAGYRVRQFANLRCCR
jgi:outer membrane receptor for ferrienterochelin and colicin